MKKIQVLFIVFCFLSTVSSIKSQVIEEPYVHYIFNSLTDIKGHSTLVPITGPPGDGSNRVNTTTGFYTDAQGTPYWRWTSSQRRGGGFRIYLDKDLKNAYTIFLKFSFDVVGPSWKK